MLPRLVGRVHVLILLIRNSIVVSAPSWISILLVVVDSVSTRDKILHNLKCIILSLVVLFVGFMNVQDIFL